MENRNPTCGCLVALAVIAAIVGLIIWRAENPTQMWTMLGILAFAIVVLGGGIYLFRQDQEGWGCFTTGWGLVVLGAVGYFIITGNFDSTRSFLRLITPTPIVVTATPADVASENAPSPTEPPPISTQTSTPTQTPVPTATLTPLAITTTQELPPQESEVPPVAWWQPDPQYIQTLTPELEQWRLYGSIIVGLQYLVILWILRRTRNPFIGRTLVGTIIGAVLTFTVFGEWIYRLTLWLFGLGIFGYVVVVLFSALSALGGLGNLTALIIGGYLFYDRNIFIWCLAPSVIVAFIALVIRVRRAIGVRILVD